MDADLERRLKELEHREAALKKISAVVMNSRPAADARLQEVEARAARAESRVAELEAQLAAEPVPAPVPAERRGRFGRRHAADPRVPELRAEIELLRARLAELEHTSPEPPGVPPPHETEPASDPEPLAVSGRPTLPQLEHLALEAERRGAPQAEEWTIYLPLLREHTGLDGTIPPHFDDILRDVFGASF